MNKPLKLNCKISDLFKAAMGIAAVDGGFIIGLHIMTFLLNYIGLKFQPNLIQDFPFGLNKGTFLILLISNINLAVIIYRIAGLTRGVKHNASTCYKQAFARLPSIIILYMLALICIMLLVSLVMLLFGTQVVETLPRYKHILTFAIFAMIPYGVMAYISVIDQDKSPLQAISAMLNTVFNKLSFGLLVNISVFYTLPLSIGILILNTSLAQYIELINAIWFLFCHIVTVIIYTSVDMLNNQHPNNKKPIKVVVI